MASNGSVPGPPGYQDITKIYNQALSKPSNKEELQVAEAERSIKFKASHTILIGFFLWIG